MTSQEISQLKQRLNTLGDQVARRQSEHESTGAFSDLHMEMWTQIHRRQAELQRKVDAALAGGSTWSIIAAQLRRDFNALCDDIFSYEEQTDAESFRGRR